jgi:hypothetical protein
VLESRGPASLAAGIAAIAVALATPLPAAAAPPTSFAELRAQVDQVNQPGAPNEIVLASGMTYSLAGDRCAASFDDDQNVDGDLDLTSDEDVTIAAPAGHPPATIRKDCPDQQRLIDVVSQSGSLTLRNVVIQGGRAPAGELPTFFPFPTSGGGIRSAGATVSLDHVTLFDNRAGDGVPGTDSALSGSGGFGGGIAAFGNASITDSLIASNRAGQGGVGWSPSGCDASPQRAPGGGPGGSGGAVAVFGTLTITRSTIVGNRAGNGGQGGTGQCGSAGSAGAEGAYGGEGGLAGGVFGLAGLTVRASTISANASGNGGAGGPGGDGTWPGGDGGPGGAGGIAGDGGGIYQPPRAILVQNSTIDGNSVGAGGSGGKGGSGLGAGGGRGDGGSGGPGGDGGQGGVLSGGSSGSETPSLVHVTATQNGGGGAPGVGGAGGAGSTAGTHGSPGQRRARGIALTGAWNARAIVIGDSRGGTGANCLVGAQSSQQSLATDSSCHFGSGNAHPFASFALGPLKANGGPTPTRLPGAASILLNRVLQTILGVDQRGVLRPQASAADVGAVERRRPPGTKITGGPGKQTSDRTPTFTFTALQAVGPVVFECRRDGGRFKRCASPHSTERLSLGRHVFEVRARNSESTPDPSPAKRKFTVVH